MSDSEDLLKPVPMPWTRVINWWKASRALKHEARVAAVEYDVQVRAAEIKSKAREEANNLTDPKYHSLDASFARLQQQIKYLYEAPAKRKARKKKEIQLQREKELEHKRKVRKFMQDYITEHRNNRGSQTGKPSKELMDKYRFTSRRPRTK